ncbi:MAG: hypothetical protein RL662_1416 [Bacteroidota bacterium]|jgi:hypothetical protein
MKKKYQRYCGFGVVIAFISLSACSGKKTELNKVPKKVELASDYLSRQAVEITDENINTKEKRKKRNSKQSEVKQKDLNELNKSPYKVKKKVNSRVYDIY